MTERGKLLNNALRKRGLNLRKLAEVARVCPRNLSRVMSGRRTGKLTFRRLMPYLHEDEQRLVVQHFGDVFD